MILHYLIRHKETGLYYVRVRDLSCHEFKDANEMPLTVKSNLAKKGKKYSILPNLNWIGRTYKSHKRLSKSTEKNFHINEYKNDYNDWEIIKVELNCDRKLVRIVF